MIIEQGVLFGFAVSGVVVSLALEYFPKLNAWYNALADNIQRLVVLGSGLLVVLGAFGLNCVEFVVSIPSWACTTNTLISVLAAFLVYIFSTQATYLVTPKKVTDA
jgi:hypothetical protein